MRLLINETVRQVTIPTKNDDQDEFEQDEEYVFIPSLNLKLWII